jgi:integrase
MTKSRSQREVRIITREEEAKLVAVLRNTEGNQKRSYFSEVADLIEVLVYTGIRKLEVMQLRYSDVDFENNMIIIRMSMGNSHRRIPMTKRVATILKRRQAVDHDRPFNITEMQIRMAWTWAKEQMGLKADRGFVLYALRWTCAYRLINAGANFYMIKLWLGHSQTNSTITERYAELARQIARSVEMDEE